MTIFQKTLFIFCMSTPVALKSMVSYHLLDTAGQKKVLVLGDHHSIEDAQVSRFLPLFVAKIIGQDLKCPVPFIVEFEQEGADRFIDAESIAQLIKIDAAQRRYGHQSFSFIYFDARGELSGALEDLHSNMGNFLVEGVPPSYILARYRKDEFTGKLETYDESPWNETKNAIEMNKLVCKGVLKTQDFNIYLKQSLTKIIALLEKYADKPQVVDLLKAHLAKYTKAQEEFMRLLQAPDMALAYTRSFLNKTLDERLTLFEQFDGCIEATDYVFAECSFFDKVMDTLATEPCACILVGDAHPKNIVQLLIASGCKLLKSETLLVYRHPLLESYTLSNDDNAASRFLRNLVQENLPIFLESVLAKPSTCWSCNKQPEKLMCCGKCTKAQYCSAECQKSNWPLHKKYCKKPIQQALKK